MARYDYRCPACDARFEVEHPMLEKPTVTCPSYGTVAQRVFEASGIVFKGSGFYNTDQRGKKGATKATSAGSTPSDAPSASEAKASKPAKADSSSGTTTKSGD